MSLGGAEAQWTPRGSPQEGILSGCLLQPSPGAWLTLGDSSELPPGARWLQFGAAQCGFKNALQEYLSGSRKHETTRVLIFGDSTDGILWNAYCDEFVKAHNGTIAGQFPPGKARWHHRLNLSYCKQDSGISFGHFFSVGVHPTGPYFEDNVLNYSRRLEQAKQEFAAKMGGEPDAIIVSSNLWDVARLSWKPKGENDNWGNILSSENRPSPPTLPARFLRNWVHNATDMIRTAQRLFPKVNREPCSPPGVLLHRCNHFPLRP